MNAFAFVPVVRGENKLSVRNQNGEHDLILIGAVGKSWWDDTGITEQEVRDALKSIPAGQKINARINSEGGSVKEGLGIYNAFKERRADITAHITGYALSIASVFPLGAGKVVSPKSAIWMMHKAWSWNQGNADDMRQAADMLDAHDDTLIDIYAAETGKSKDEIRSAMEKETWIKGGDAVDFGLADETDSDDDESQASYRQLPKDYLNRCKAPTAILNALSAAPKQGAVQPKQQQETTMNKKLIVALLTKHGIDASETETEEQLQSSLDKVLTAKLQKDSSAENLKAIVDLRKEFAAIKNQRIEDKINAYVDQNRITKAQAKVFLAQAIVGAESEKDVFAALEETTPINAGGEPAGVLITEVDGPVQNSNGVQGKNILPELDNIFAAHKEPAGATQLQRLAVSNSRYDAMKAGWPRLISKAFAKDSRGGVQAANTFSATITTNFLILGIITKLYGRFAAAKLFTRDADTDPYKPLAPGIRKFNSTTTDGSKVGKNVTNFEALSGGTAGNPDSQIDAVTITPDQYTGGGNINNSQLNSGFRIADLTEAKLADFAAKITQVMTAPLTVANIVTNAPLVVAPAAFGFGELADLQGSLKKSLIKNILLDGEYLARIANTPAFFQRAGTVMDATSGASGAWSAFGWDNIALNTDWSGAGANVRGVACNPQVIGIVAGLPLTPPEGIPGNIVMTGVAQLPDVQLAIATYAWFSALDRTFHFTYDIILGATLVDETAGRLIKSA